jgi:hypothetical protein
MIDKKEGEMGRKPKCVNGGQKLAVDCKKLQQF